MSKIITSQYDKMTKTPVPRLLVSLSIPTVITMLISSIYNLADTAFVGKLGNSASGAVGVVFGFMSILQAIGFFLWSGLWKYPFKRTGSKEK